jgi:thiamine transport system substrate-binding protein
MQSFPRWLLLFALLLLPVACGAEPTGPAEPAAPAPEPADVAQPVAPTPTAVVEPAASEEPRVVRLVTHDSFNVTEDVLTAFEEEHDVTVEILPLGDTGSLVNQSILTINNPLGDALFGIDNTFLTRALENDLFEPYESPELNRVPERFVLDNEHRVTPIDYGDVCLNYDIPYFEEAALAPPSSLEDLTLPEYRGMTVVMNPATSSPGLAFLLATVHTFGEEGWEQFWANLRDNEVLVTSGWSEAYFEHFTAGGGDGNYPIVVSYASSPPFTEGRTTSVLADGSCFRQVEFAGVLRNAENPVLARALIDFMLTPAFQNDVPVQMYVFPVIEGAELPGDFVQWAAVPENPATVDPAFIEENRDTLIERWNEIVLR